MRSNWSTGCAKPHDEATAVPARPAVPRPAFDVHALDRTVTYEHFSQFTPGDSKISTPDWMLHLLAADGGFDGVVTLDRSQLDEEAELVALSQAGISVVTWRKGDEDPVVLCGQLLAYMPQVLKVIHMSARSSSPSPTPASNSLRTRASPATCSER